MAGLRAGRVEHLDQALERHVGVREGAQIGLADLGQQLPEGLVRGDLGAQHQGVHEHTDQVVQHLLAAPRDHRADRDIAGARQFGEQRHEGRVQRHEQGGAIALRELPQPHVPVGGDGEAVLRAPAGRHGRTGPVGG
ncbi:hypothetical protein NSERKGN1266_73850 [Nocardia seriolae]|nr:hypothetical protein NSERKGN1266_73850 [Nocardia seriolae]